MDVASSSGISKTALMADLYLLTMAQGFTETALAEREAVFHLFFRANPFHGGFTVACGLETALAHIESASFGDDDIAYLASLCGGDGKALFKAGFLERLRRLRFGVDVDAIPEGTVVFPQEPLLRVRGPLLEAQLLETALLNTINFQTLIATKAARVVLAAGTDPVLEFGLRRAQGIDGGLSASRAAYVGGCAGTSNALAGQAFGIPVRGTHAHSWVMSFADERQAFDAYADCMPGNCVFLVDTYDTLQGVRNAIAVAAARCGQGFRLAGIRLDSGDLAYLSREARKLLDAAGFQETAIIASNDLDEHLITSLKQQGAAISAWGVGTRLVTGFDQPALGGVYKLAAWRTTNADPWQQRIKLSDHAAKVTNPGILQVRRFRGESWAEGDMIYDTTHGAADDGVIVDPMDATRRKRLPGDVQTEDLLVPVLRGGRRVADTAPRLQDLRERTAAQLALFHPGIKRFVNPHEYPVGLDTGLHRRKTAMILAAKGFAE